MTVSTSRLKIKIGIILFVGNFLFAFFAALFFALQWLSELDIILIGSSFVSVGPVAKSFFDAIAFEQTNNSQYAFSDNELEEFVTSLRKEIARHYSDKEEYYVIPKTKLQGFLQYPFNRPGTSKDHLNLADLMSKIEALLTYFSSIHRGAYLSMNDLAYYLTKIIAWIRQRQSYEASKPVSDLAQFFMLFSTIAHPAIGIILLWLKALNTFDLSPENMGQVSALSSAIFSGYWVSTIKRLNANVIND